MFLPRLISPKSASDLRKPTPAAARVRVDGRADRAGALAAFERLIVRLCPALADGAGSSRGDIVLRLTPVPGQATDWWRAAQPAWRRHMLVRHFYSLDPHLGLLAGRDLTLMSGAKKGLGDGISDADVTDALAFVDRAQGAGLLLAAPLAMPAWRADELSRLARRSYPQVRFTIARVDRVAADLAQNRLDGVVLFADAGSAPLLSAVAETGIGPADLAIMARFSGRSAEVAVLDQHSGGDEDGEISVPAAVHAGILLMRHLGLAAEAAQLRAAWTACLADGLQPKGMPNPSPYARSLDAVAFIDEMTDRLGSPVPERADVLARRRAFHLVSGA